MLPYHKPAGLDTEFLEDGETIELISIGIDPGGGDSYYAVNADMPVERIKQDPWLLENVWPHLPRTDDDELDLLHPDVKPKNDIAQEVVDFLRPIEKQTLLVADCEAYDHVAFCQIFGRMIDLPEGYRWWTYNLRQLLFDLGDDIALPEQVTPRHHALNDAKWARTSYLYLRERQMLAA